jgi:eukaryotic-like serine/threonine-protein kinase
MGDSLGRIEPIIGDYRLQRRLGGGTFGTVYLAEHRHEQTQVAVKVLNMQLTDREHFREFLNEARAMRLRHPHIVPLLDFGVSQQDQPFLVMEYAPKGTLRNAFPRGVPAPLSKVVDYTGQIAEALQYAHDRRLIHRDVKPENMLLRDENTALLADFGITISAPSTNMVSVREGGTPVYMAPEQIDGHPQPASDQYALAIVVYEWLTGKRPFNGTLTELIVQHLRTAPPSLREYLPSLSVEIEQVIFTALAKDPKQRFASVQAFATALQLAYQGGRAQKSLFGHFSQASLHSKRPFSQTLPASAPLPSLSHQEAKVFMQRPENKTILPRVVNTSKLPNAPGEKSFLAEKALAQKRGISKGLAIVLGVLLLALIGAGSYTYVGVSTFMAQSQATAIAVKRYTTATAEASINAYEANALKNGSMYGFNVQHTHVNPYEHILNTANVSLLKQKWTFITGDNIHSSPAIANGVVYIGSNDQKLYAINAATGAEKWAAPTGNSIYSSPISVNGVVYVGSFDRKLYAFDAQTGAQKWAMPTGGLILSSPIVVNGLVYVGSDDKKLYAFDALTGKQKWVVATTGVIDGSPAFLNGVVYIGSAEGNVYAFNALTGQQNWVTVAGKYIETTIAVANGMVYVGSDDKKLYAFDMLTGKQKWVMSTGGSVESSAAVANGLVYVGSDDQNLYAFDAFTGTQKWVASTTGAIRSSPTVANGVVYVGSEDDNMYAFDALTGRKLWTAATAGFIYSSPTIANGMLYVGSYDKELYCFSLPAPA